MPGPTRDLRPDPAGIERIGVAVPARNEAASIARCLTALAAAASAVPLPVAICVVADACRDATATVASDLGARLGLDLTVTVIGSRSVGRARAAGLGELIARLGVAGTWLATTDADSSVPGDWLARQLAHARTGVSMVAGTVRVDDWSAWPPAVRIRAERDYADAGGRHVHGANLSFRADAYGRVGGFTPRVLDEDVALVAAFVAHDEPVTWSADMAVRTSARRMGRAPAGFAGYLAALDAAGGPAPAATP